MALWMILNGFLALGSIGQYMALSASYPAGSPNVGSLSLIFCTGVAGFIVALQLRKGSTAARTTMTILGAFQLLGIFTAVLIVPALILQYRPSSNAWFRAMNARRYPPPGPPMPPPGGPFPPPPPPA